MSISSRYFDIYRLALLQLFFIHADIFQTQFFRRDLLGDELFGSDPDLFAPYKAEARCEPSRFRSRFELIEEGSREL